MAARAKPPFRADHVGSFLRPKELLEAREKRAKGEIPKEALRKVEDAAIRDVVRFQEDLGLQGITDGEFRRTYFHIDFLEQLDGVESHGGLTAQFHTKKGDIGFAPPVRKAAVSPAASRSFVRLTDESECERPSGRRLRRD